jgi:anthranilate synthase component 1
MQIESLATAFAKRYARGESQVVWTTLVSDLETPVSAFLKIAGQRPMSFLLESVEGGEVRGRYSIIGLNPDLILRTPDGRAEIPGSSDERARFKPCNEAPLVALRAIIAESRIDLPENLPPMAAGIFGYLGYDMVRLMEDLPDPNPDPIGIPDAMLVRPTIVVVFDAVTDTITVVTPVRPAVDVSAETAFTQAGERLAAVVQSLDAPLAHTSPRMKRGPITVWPSSNTPAAEYERMVGVARNTSLPGMFRSCSPSVSRRLSSFRHLHSIGFAQDKSRAIPIFPRFWQLRHCRLQPGDSGARARRDRHNSTVSRNQAARRHTARRQGARSCSFAGSKRTRRTSDAA